MSKTMVTMFRPEFSFEDNLYANVIFSKWVKKHFPHAKLEKSTGFWKNFSNPKVDLEPGVTIDNLTENDLAKIREYVANTEKINPKIKGHDQFGFIEVLDNNKIKTYSLGINSETKNNEFKLCDGTGINDWGHDLEHQLDLSITDYQKIENNISIGGTFIHGKIISYVNNEQNAIIKNTLNKSLNLNTENNFIKDYESLEPLTKKTLIKLNSHKSYVNDRVI